MANETSVSPESQSFAGSPSEATVSIRIPREQFMLLEDLAHRQGIDSTDAIAQAIGIAKIVVDADQSADERVLVQKGRQLQELTLA